MKINRLHAIIGFLLVLIPLTDLSRTYKYGLTIFGGAIILFFAVQSIHREVHKKHRKPLRHDTFVESRPTNNLSAIEKENLVENPELKKPENDFVDDDISLTQDEKDLGV